MTSGLGARVLGGAAACLASFVSLGCGGEGAEVAPQTPPPLAPEPSPTAPVAVTPPPRSPPKPSMLDTQIALAKTIGEVINEPEKVAALYAPDAVSWTVGQLERKGRDAILKGAEELTAMFADMKSANSRLWIKGSTMVVQWVTPGPTGPAASRRASPAARSSP